MSDYIDGFVFPINKDKLADYQKLAIKVADIWKEHGAIDYREFVGDDMHLEGTLPFTDITSDSENEVIIFGYVSFADKSSRDIANEKVASDPRMNTLMSMFDTGFDASRMAYGGFKSLIG